MDPNGKNAWASLLKKPSEPSFDDGMALRVIHVLCASVAAETIDCKPGSDEWRRLYKRIHAYNVDEQEDSTMLDKPLLQQLMGMGT
jgi:predicted secreted protein